MPDDYLVYYEPNIDNRRPDFIVIAPDLGVIVIEVKGWYLDDIERVSDSEVVTLYDGRPKAEVHPLTQARNYQWRLVKACEKNPRFSHLLHKDGPHKNRFTFPFGHFVILSNISQEHLQNYRGHDLSAVFRPQNTMTRDVLVSLENASPQEIAAKLRSYFDPFWRITPLSQEQIDVLRAIIHPEIILSYVPSCVMPAQDPVQSAPAENDTVQEPEDEYVFSYAQGVCEPKVRSLKVLDRRQENTARKIGDGHRIACGVAGSGKTVILVARARWLHDRDPEAKILLLCYNVSLGAYLKNILVGYPRITVTHFDGWAKQNGVIRNRCDPVTGLVEDDEHLGHRLKEQLSSRVGDFRAYDAVLVDEAQDFHPIWFSCILLAMKDPYDGDLLIVCDGNQGIRPVGTVSWKSVGIKAQGRTIHRALDLDRNYRNTREILKLASHFASQDTQFNEDSFGIIPVDPYQAQRTGSKPFLVQCADHHDECQKTLEIVKGLLAGRLPDGNAIEDLHHEEIGILYRRASAPDKELLGGLIEEIRQYAPVVWINEDASSRARVLDEGIKIQTVDSAKGLQYRVVILLWPDAFVPVRAGDLPLENSRFYVALTRAEDVLIILHSSENEHVNRMLASDDVVIC
ncbi:hypothetical protein ABH15_07460 [Methanoculleus taiwanensis]|uniref:Uncharacterized protein n=1 Tax=Methanoculleus taiwanensis TaxID=1550565 RepID=A0A498H278_9EURY|nr:hypothetical protein ABH15_07460 [Methanoculleus taiwanensis]